VSQARPPRRCSSCADGTWHCGHTGYVLAGSMLLPCQCPDCDPTIRQLSLLEER
jgi:hypothetical protein